MSELYHTEEEPQYIRWDGANYTNFEDQLAALKNSKTVYVGNLSFFTKESQILETFSVAGPVKRIIMGLNNFSKTPCGFCFVEYYHQEHAFNALKYITETVCDERLIRCDADPGFLPGRQFGRGKSGGQIRDERRIDYDPARGRFIPPAVIGYHQNRGFRNNNHRSQNPNYHSNRGFKRNHSREDYSDDRGREDYRGNAKRARQNAEGHYHQGDQQDRYEDDHRPRRRHYQNDHRRRDNFDEARYSRQNSADTDMEVHINSSLETARD